MDRIAAIKGREILNAKGRPTVEAQLITERGIHVTASVPSGTSRGKYEAFELYDGETRHNGRGARKAAENISTEICRALAGMDVADQEAIDQTLCRLDGTPDKRTKLYKTLEKHACFAEFAHAEEQELVAWLERRAKALGCMIEPGDASYMIFLCGNSMTNLAGEMEKAAAHTTTGVIKRYNIDAVCSPVLDAVVFDLTDAVTAGRFDRAVALVGELLAQKNNEVMIFTAITRHIQRLYAAKLCAENRGGEKQLMEMIGSKSPYYARQIQNAARRVPLSWLRKAASLCAETDAALKGGAADRQKQIELTLLTMAAELKGEKK